MTLDRRAVRMLFPPLVAAALTALTVTPSLARSDDPPASSAASAASRAPAPPTDRPTQDLDAGNVTVGVPAVAFTSTVTARDGRLRTPVLINVAELPGRVTVVAGGQGDDCRGDAQPGVVLWLECSLNPRAAQHPRIRVVLQDGRRVEKAISMS